MNKKKLLEDCLEKGNGLITLVNAKDLNVSRKYFNRFVKEKGLVKVSQGVYKLSDAIEDEYYLL